MDLVDELFVLLLECKCFFLLRFDVRLAILDLTLQPLYLLLRLNFPILLNQHLFLQAFEVTSNLIAQASALMHLSLELLVLHEMLCLRRVQFGSDFI